MGRHGAKFKGKKALQFLQQICPKLRSSITRSLVKDVLEMDARGWGFTHAWPGNFTEKDIPRIRDWLVDAEDCRPGCLITWFENDAINACFDEEAQHMGENGPCQPNVALPIHLDKRSEEHTSELQSPDHLVCRLLLETKKRQTTRLERSLCRCARRPRGRCPPT